LRKLGRIRVGGGSMARFRITPPTAGPPAARESLSARVQTGTALAAGGFAITQLLTLTSYFALARLVTPATFGTVAAASILVSAGAMFAESGMGAALVQWRGDVESAAATALVVTVGGGLLLAMAAAASAPLIGLVFGSHEVTLLAAASAGIIVLHASAVVPSVLMQRNLSFARRVIVEPAAAVAFGAAAIGGCAAGLGTWGLLAGSYASAVVLATLSWTLARWRPRLSLASMGTWRRLAKFGRHVLASEVISRGGTIVETTCVGRFLGAGALGQYRYGYRLASQPLSAWVNIAAFVMLPAFCRISDDEPRLRRAFLRALRWMAALMMPVSVIAVPLGPTLAVALFGRPWRQAGVALAAMAAFSAAYGLVSVASETWKAIGRPDLLSKVNLVRLASTILMIVALLPFGLTGVALALSVSALLTAAYAASCTSAVLDISLPVMLREIWRPGLSALLAATACYALNDGFFHGATGSSGHALIALISEVPAAAAVYTIGLMVMAPRLKTEIATTIAGQIAAIRRSGLELEPS
jgi:O-antigen/teichoic acid export membrane protein